MKDTYFNEIAVEDIFFKDTNNSPYVLAKVNGHLEVIKVESSEYKDLVEKRLYKIFGDYSNKEVKKIIDTSVKKAKFEGKTKELHLRIAENSGKINYDLSNQGWLIVRVSGEGWGLVNSKRVVFLRLKNHIPQVIPTVDGDFNLIDKYLRNLTEKEKILIKIHIVLCFIPQISHAIVLLKSEHGSGKTTLTKILKSIIDPCNTNAMVLSHNEKDLILSLQNNYFACFDNISHIPQFVSDIFCQAVTGATSSSRKLFTDDELVHFSLKNCILLNGIDFGHLKEDLMDRGIFITLNKLKQDERMADSILWEEFNKDLPKILGGIFDILAEAMRIYENLEDIETSFRLIDYAKWGCAVAEAMGIKLSKYLDCLEKNYKDKYSELASSNALCQAIIHLMEDRQEWNGSPTKLLEVLEKIERKYKLGRNLKSWSSSSISLGINLKKIKPLLANEGIQIEKKEHTRNGSMYKIIKE